MKLKIFARLLSYSLKYRLRFSLGILFAIITAILNAVSLTAFIPLFDALGSNQKNKFQLELTIPEKQIQFKEKVFGYDELDGLEKIKRVLLLVKLSINETVKEMEPKEIVWMICKLIVPLYFLKLIFYLLSVFCIATSGYLAVRDLRQQLYDKAQKLPLTFFYKEKTGLLMSRIINDAEIVAAVISSNLRDAIINFFYVITHLFILLYLNTELVIIAAIAVPVVIYPVTLFTKKITKSTLKFQERLADLNANVHEMISGIRVIRSFGLEKYEEGKFSEINQKATHRNFKGQFYLQMAPNLVEFTSSLVVLGFFALGARLIFNGSFTQGEFMAFLLTLLFLLRPLTQLSQMVGKITQAVVAGDRIFEIIDREDFEKNRNEISTYQKTSKFTDSIEFRSISFAYPETTTEVFKDFSLKVKIGDTVALVGSSGSGKSTLMDLIPRFYAPKSGEIIIDGMNIENISLSDLRRSIGIVTQDIFLFQGSVFDNIAYGRPSSSRREVIRAARLAHAHDFIMEMDYGYDTILGVRGLNLSGGQRQRLVIARALLRDPEILILDEATSALDSKSERLVSDALDRLFKNRTTFIIAHRLSTIRKIPRILVLDNGTIIEEGDHESLLKKNGAYSRLYESQFVT
ncbi:MAG: ABC transporter ATP-binding protein [Leptospiraceae bacterium]|nr:ABC transporter ATP-binding protein [Leptospiraceae bacterium]